jgi:hypothetical protein
MKAPEKTHRRRSERIKSIRQKKTEKKRTAGRENTRKPPPNPLEETYFNVLNVMAARVESRGPELYAGTDVIYLGHIGGRKFKYGQSSNFSRRLLAHRKTHAFDRFVPLKIYPCLNGVASEGKVRRYVQEHKLSTSFQWREKSFREIIEVKTLPELYALTVAMHRFSVEPPRSL